MLLCLQFHVWWCAVALEICGTHGMCGGVDQPRGLFPDCQEVLSACRQARLHQVEVPGGWNGLWLLQVQAAAAVLWGSEEDHQNEVQSCSIQMDQKVQEEGSWHPTCPQDPQGVPAKPCRPAGWDKAHERRLHDEPAYWRRLPGRRERWRQIGREKRGDQTSSARWQEGQRGRRRATEQSCEQWAARWKRGTEWRLIPSIEERQRREWKRQVIALRWVGRGRRR